MGRRGAGGRRRAGRRARAAARRAEPRERRSLPRREASPPAARALPGRADVRRLHASLAHWTGWNGQCLARSTERRALRGGGCGQAPEREPRRSRRRGTLPAGGQHPGSPGRSPHRSAVRRRRLPDGPAVSGSRVRRGRADRSVLRRAQPDHRGADPALSRRPGSGRARPREPHRSPGHQTFQRPRRPGRTGETPRLRHRQVPRGRRRRRPHGADARGGSGAHAGVRGPRTGDGRRGDDGNRRLRPRNSLVPPADRPPPRGRRSPVAGGARAGDPGNRARAPVRPLRRQSCSACGGTTSGRRRSRDDAGRPAPRPQRRSRHDRAQGPQEERCRALSVGHGPRRGPATPSPPRADQRDPGHVRLPGRQVRSQKPRGRGRGRRHRCGGPRGHPRHPVAGARGRETARRGHGSARSGDGGQRVPGIPDQRRDSGRTENLVERSARAGRGAHRQAIRRQPLPSNRDARRHRRAIHGRGRLGEGPEDSRAQRADRSRSRAPRARPLPAGGGEGGQRKGRRGERL